MEQFNRRRFLRATAVGASAIGTATAVTGSSAATSWQTGDVPAYADWVPAVDDVRSETGNLEVGHLEIDPLLELFALDDGEDDDEEEDEDPSLVVESFTIPAFVAVFEWPFLSQLGLDEPVLGGNPDEELESGELLGGPAETQTIIGSDTSVYLGEFDTDAIAAAVDEQDFEEVEDGIFQIEEAGVSQVIAWGEEYVLFGMDPDRIARVREAGTGDRDSWPDVEPDLSTILARGSGGDFIFTRYAFEDELTIQDEDVELFGFDYSPVETAKGYTQSARFDLDEQTFEATMALVYASEDRIDTGRLDPIGAGATDRDLTVDGRFVTIQMLFTEQFPGGIDRADFDGREDTDDQQDDDGTDDENGTGDDTDGTGDDTDGSDDDTDGTDDDTDGTGDDGTGDDETEDEDTQQTDDEEINDSDDDGAGFGVMAALSGVGGAAYVLSRRLGREKE